MTFDWETIIVQATVAIMNGRSERSEEKLGKLPGFLFADGGIDVNWIRWRVASLFFLYFFFGVLLLRVGAEGWERGAGIEFEFLIWPDCAEASFLRRKTIARLHISR